MFGNLLEVATDVSRWVHPDAVITSRSKSSSLHFSTTLQTVNGDVSITVSPPYNGGGLLVLVYYEWVNRCIVPTLSITPKGLQAS